MSGQLVICNSCNKSAALSARVCPSCGAALVARRTNGLGWLGWFLVVDGLLGCPFTGGWSLLSAGVGAVFVMIGRSEQLDRSAIRLATTTDAERLGLSVESLAPRLPALLRPGTLIVLGTAAVCLVAYGLQTMWSEPSLGPLLPRTAPTPNADTASEAPSEPAAEEPAPSSDSAPEARWYCLCAREFDEAGSTTVTSCRTTAAQCRRLEIRATSGDTLELLHECEEIVGATPEAASGLAGWEPSAFRGGWQLRGSCALP